MVELSPLNRPKSPSESTAPGLPSAESLCWLGSDPEARDMRRAEGSSFAQRSEVDEPYSHSDWRFWQFEHVGRTSSHCEGN